MALFTFTSLPMNARTFVVVASMIGLSGPAAAQTRPVTLEWDATREGAAGYVVFVGQASGSYAEQYDVGNQTTFAYTRAVSGRPYYFAVAAYSAGHQLGERSEELFFLSGAVTSTPRTDPRDGTVPATPVPSSTTRRGNVFCAAPTGCYDVETLAGFPGSVDSLTVTGDGRLFFIEDRARLRAVSENALVARPMLEAEGTQQFTGLILDPDYARTKWLYLGMVETRGNGDREFSVVRYREVAEVLGEGATLVAGLPLSRAGDASVAMDAAGRFYVAMPDSDGASNASRYAGMVLRFERDGTAVRSDGPRAPVFAVGYSKPASLAWTADSSSLWLAGTGGVSQGTVTRYSTHAANTPYRTTVADSRVTALSALPTGNATAPDRPVLVLVDGAGGVSHVWAGPNGISTTPWITADALGGVVSAVSNVWHDDVYLALVTSSEPASSSIIRLRQK